MRNGITGVQQAMDNLSYHYTVGTNKLDHVTDAVVSSPYTDDIESQGAGNYDYDAIGNLIKDEAEEIETIEWTPSGKVKRIKRQRRSSLPDMEFWYDAMGQRTVKVVKPRPFGNLSDQSQWEYTHYVRDAQGNVLSVYSQTYVASMVHEGLYESHLKLAEQHVYGSSRIGMSTQETEKVSTFNAVPSSIAGETFLISRNTYTLPDYSASTDKVSRKVGHKRYELNNHLGNVMVTVSDLKLSSNDTTVTYYLPQVVSYTDYYAFGSQQPGRYGNTGGYRYGFQGQEKDDEIKGEGNSINYKYRIHDPRLGRFLSVDPLAADYAYNSPYAFSENRVVDMVELEGLEATSVERNLERNNEKVGRTDAEYIEYRRKEGLGALFLLGGIIDLAVTKGAISKMIFKAAVTYEVANIFGEIHIAQNAERMGNQAAADMHYENAYGSAANLTMAWGATKLLAPITEGLLVAASRVSKRLELAEKWKIRTEYIDFEKPVYTSTLKKGEELIQYRTKGAEGYGSYYAKPGTTPEQIGLSSSDVVEQYRVIVNQDSKVLFSTHKKNATYYKDDSIKIKGGGQQIYSRDLKNNVTFQKIENP